jgi:hypothetical protein
VIRHRVGDRMSLEIPQSIAALFPAIDHDRLRSVNLF